MAFGGTLSSVGVAATRHSFCHQTFTKPMSRHIDDILSVGYVNSVAVAISVSEFETGLRIFSLFLAITYTGYKFYKALQAK
jgi:hypothetical protein